MDALQHHTLQAPAMYPFDPTAYHHAYVTPTHTPSTSDSGSPPYSTYSPNALAATASATTAHSSVFPSGSSDSLTPPYVTQMGVAGPSFTASVQELSAASSTKPAVEDFDAEAAPPSLAASFSGPYGQLTRPLTHREESVLAHLDRLKFFLATAPSRWGSGGAGVVVPDGTGQMPAGHPASTAPALNRFALPNHEYVSCVLWEGLYHITGTDIVRALVFRFEAFGRPVRNMKKFEEGVFSDLRNLKPGVDACLEEPKSAFLDLLFKYQCIRTQKKQKVFYWFSVPHDRLFLDALDRDLKRERAGQEPTSAVTGEPALSFQYDPKRSLYEQFLPSVRAGEGELEAALRAGEGSDSERRSPFAHMFSLFEGSPNYKTRGKPKRRIPNALTLIAHGQSADLDVKAEPSALGLQMGGFGPAPDALQMHGPAEWDAQHHPQMDQYDNEFARAHQHADSNIGLSGQEQPSPPAGSVGPALNSVSVDAQCIPSGMVHRPALERRHNSYPVSACGPAMVPHPHAPVHAVTLPAFVPGSNATPTSAELAAQAQLQAATLGTAPRVRGFVCPLYTCGRTFKRMEHLKRHVRTHTLERPFACQTCDKRFARSDNLTQHLRTHARENSEGGQSRSSQAPQSSQNAQQDGAGTESDTDTQGEVPLSSGYTTYASSFQVSPLPLHGELSYGEEFTTQLSAMEIQTNAAMEGQDGYYASDNNGVTFNAVVTSASAPESGSVSADATAVSSGNWLSPSPYAASPQPGLAGLDSRPDTASSLSTSPMGHARHLSADSGSFSAPSHRASFDAAGLVPPSSRPGTASPGGPVRRYRSTTPSFPRAQLAAQRRPSDYELAAPRGYHPYAAVYGTSDSAHSSPAASVAALDYAPAAQPPAGALPRAMAHARSSSSLRGDMGNMLTFPDAHGGLQAYAAFNTGFDPSLGANSGLMFSSPGMLQNQTLPYRSPPPTVVPTQTMADSTFYALTVPNTGM